MLISELIEKLGEIMGTEGDIRVAYTDREEYLVELGDSDIEVLDGQLTWNFHGNYVAIGWGKYVQIG